jgi:hypothetical protein
VEFRTPAAIKKTVIAGLEPAIQETPAAAEFPSVKLDCRFKAGNDDPGKRASEPTRRGTQ